MNQQKRSKRLGRKRYPNSLTVKVQDFWVNTPMNSCEIAEKLSVSKFFVQRRIKGLKSKFEKKKRIGLKFQKPELYKQMIELWKTTSIGKKPLAKMLKISESCVIKQLKNIPYNKGLNKDDGKYKKGSISWNKGTKGLTSANKTSFVKGDPRCKIKIPHGEPQYSHRKDGTVEVLTTIPEKRLVENSDGRVSETFKRIYYSRYVWEKHYGKIPKGMIVYNKDGNPLNNNIDNLMLMTRSKLLRLNQDKYLEKIKKYEAKEK